MRWLVSVDWHCSEARYRFPAIPNFIIFHSASSFFLRSCCCGCEQRRASAMTDLYDTPLTSTYHPDAAGAQGALPPPTHWQSGIFHCLEDTGSTCDVIWCGYCQIGYQYSMVTRNVQEMDLQWTLFPFLIDLFTRGLGFIFATWTVRNEVRRRFNITPNQDIEEGCLTFWCAPCALCQQHRELTGRQMWPKGVCLESPPYLKSGMA